MASEIRSEVYERGLKLAEAGRHEEALTCIQQHMQEHPRDAQAWNDAGAILYCMGRVDEAITHFEKARSLTGDPTSAEIYWNLAEAYLDAERPSDTMRLFDVMESMGILNPDLINRTADAFLRAEALGNALEMLLRSLEMAPEQEILTPMVEVIRSKRARVAICGSRQTEALRELNEYLSIRYQVEVHTGKSAEDLRPVLEWADICWLEGCDEAVAEVVRQPNTCRTVIRVDACDVYYGSVDRIAWERVDAVVLAGGAAEKEVLLERAAGIEKQTRLVSIPHGVNTGELRFACRNRGRNIAWIGDLNAASNPMFLLQCMQKLNYIDSAYRLYVAGEFTDRATESYVREMVEQLGLTGSVFFDGPVRNLGKWLRDKQYVVSTGISAGSIQGVLQGMSCGLKPVVHWFPGVEEALPGEFVFHLAEDFCNRILADEYEPSRYRSLIAERYSLKREMKALNDVIYRFEKEPLRTGGGSEAFAPAPVYPTSMPVEPEPASFQDMGAGAEPVAEVSDSLSTFAPQGRDSNVASFEPLESNILSAETPGERPRIIPIEPVAADSVDVRIGDASQPGGGEPASPQATEPMSGSSPETPFKPVVRQRKKDIAANAGAGRIEQLAKEALQASQKLSEMARRDGQSSTPSRQGDFHMEWSPTGFSSLEDARAEDRVQKAATEFQDGDAAAPRPQSTGSEGAFQIPFGKVQTRG